MKCRPSGPKSARQGQNMGAALAREWEDGCAVRFSVRARAAIWPSPNLPPLSPASDPVGLFSLIASHQARGHAR
jgi:hypothetical protein